LQNWTASAIVLKESVSLTGGQQSVASLVKRYGSPWVLQTVVGALCLPTHDFASVMHPLGWPVSFWGIPFCVILI
jgi:hypothetical protein